MSSKAKQSLKTYILKQQSGDSEVIQKINQLLNRFTTVPETPTNSGKSTSRIQTRSSKAINALGHDSNESSSDKGDDSDKSSLKVSPIMTNSITKWNGLIKPSAYSYNRVSAPDLALEERERGTANQAAHETSEEAIANVIVSGFSGQLKGWTPFLQGSIPEKTFNNLSGKKNSLQDFPNP
ncbi:uncharacterized protein DS421_11g334730 [Arachis hypogaea]|nr:uncharacterized protein DS421_11g334730 [Arachis hypogaea]